MKLGWDANASRLNLELLLALVTLHPAPITASGRLRARSLNALTLRMAAWATRTKGTGRVWGVAAAGGAPVSPNPDPCVTSMPALITLAEGLHLIAPTAGHLRPLPTAAAWFALALGEQRRDIEATLLRLEPGDHTDLGEQGAIASTESPAADDVAAARAARDLLRLEPDLSLLDGPNTVPGARLALAAWAEWDDARACLRLTKASVSRAASPILAAGQDAAQVLADLLIQLAEPAPTAAQLRQLHGWCVATPAVNAGDRLPRKRSLPDDAGIMAWRLAALRLVATLAPSVPGIGSPPAEAYEGLGAAADPALDWLVGGWAAAIMNAKGVGGLPVGVDPRLLETVEAALAMGEGLHLRYRADEAVETWREVTPLRLEWHRGRLLLLAHCRLREAERHFRMDRVLDVRPAAGRLATERETS